MSFNRKVKDELLLLKDNSPADRRALLSGFAYCMKAKDGVLHFSAENEHITDYLRKLAAECGFKYDENSLTLGEKKLFDVHVPTGGDHEAGLFLRGVFLAAGVIADPQNSYHLEINGLSSAKNGELMTFMAEHGIPAGKSVRKGKHFLYIKESERIVDFLTFIGAMHHSMEIMNTKIFKEVRNNVNRAVNCEAANIEKTAAAASRQIADIELIYDLKGETFLPPELRAVADLRINNIELSLKQIGELCEPRISRSGVNHRLKKIAAIAEALRAGNGG